MTSDLEMLQEAAAEITAAFSKGLSLTDPEYYCSLGKKYGPLAYEVFRELAPDLPWDYVLFRSKSIQWTLDDLQFWLDEQAVLVLYEVLEKKGDCAA